MHLGFIGSGPVAQNLARLAAAAGHEVLLSARNPDKLVNEFKVVGFDEAARWADIAVLAIPFRAAKDMLPSVASALADKVVVDATNPLNEDYTPILLAPGSSAGETIAELLPRSTVVKAFNTVFAEVMQADRLDRGGWRATTFVASEDPGARAKVALLARELGFAPVEAGPLAMARYLEGMAHLNIQIAFREGGGPNAAFLYDQAST